ncbi:MAG: hypothetical protein K8I60_15805 [Anaerolineae bacterium]|nr:hypothetical protein [Anaerolineae bacterium]
MVLKNYETTTILYYAFFLPGVFLYELSYWMMAGLLNVRADRAIGWPEKQEIGELKLNFVELSPKTGPLRLAIITITPFITGLLIVSLIANRILDVQQFLNMLSNGFLSDVTGAINQFTSAPDFWLWLYITFTISNTAMPSMKDLRGLRGVLLLLAVISGVLFLLGIGNDTVVTVLAVPVTATLNNLAGILIVIIGVNIFTVAVLGTIEALIERITGDSATFENGKMVTMTRQEMLDKRAKDREKARRGKSPAAAPQYSIYQFPLPTPGSPGKEAITPAFEVTTQQAELPVSTSSVRDEPSVIPGGVAGKPELSGTTHVRPFASPFGTAEDKSSDQDTSQDTDESA